MVSRAFDKGPTIMGTVVAPARLHFNSVDLSGHLGILGVGLGLTLRQPSLKLQFRKSPILSVSGNETERVATWARRMMTAFDLKTHANLHLATTIPPHMGLGSGTQIALAVAVALLTINNKELSYGLLRQAAKALGRSSFSGVGFAAFCEGGFVVDAGYTPEELENDLPVHQLLRVAFPDEWEILLVEPGIFKATDVDLHYVSPELLRREPPMSLKTARLLAHLVLVGLLPAIARKDFKGFSLFLDRICRLGYKRKELGSYGRRMLNLLDRLREFGDSVAVMSSGGPTLALFSETAHHTSQLREQLRTLIGPMRVLAQTSANNSGFLVE